MFHESEATYAQVPKEDQRSTRAQRIPQISGLSLEPVHTHYSDRNQPLFLQDFRSPCIIWTGKTDLMSASMKLLSAISWAKHQCSHVRSHKLCFSLGTLSLQEASCPYTSSRLAELSEVTQAKLPFMHWASLVADLHLPVFRTQQHFSLQQGLWWGW